MSRWPDVVWGAAVLRGLDERGRAEIEAAGALRSLAKGEAVYRAGDPADAFFVVVEGACEVRAVRRGEADSSVIRRVTRGEALGEEATLRAAGRRAMDAVAAEASRVAEIKVTVFRRAAGRTGAGDAALARVERTLRRAATGDLLRTMSFTRELPAKDLDLLLDAVEHREIARGEALFRAGDRATHVYFVADGMLQVQTEDLGRLHVRAFVARGDVLGDTDLGERDVSAIASGPAWVLAVPAAQFAAIAERHAELLPRIRRVAAAQRDAQHAFARAANTTQHVFKDLYRIDIARSLLVIDQDTCVRCGHCAWACASVHDDGVPRIVRRGDKVVVPRGEDARTSLLLPNSCQHCENPACMIDCPTGAIGRDPRGEVFIREALCVGCGQCAKACPWDNIEMAPRARAKGSTLSESVAVKCDLCSDLAAGPACVRACPTEAITRLNPSDALPEIAGLLGAGKTGPAAPLAARRRAWPWLASAAVIAIALGRAPLLRTASPLESGIATGVLLALLAAYVFAKRVALGVKRRRAPAPEGAPVRSRVRVHFVAHLALGVVTTGVVVAHGALAFPANVAGALHLSFWGATIAGALAAIAYRVLPARLTRIERGGALPEDLPRRARDLDERVFAELTGRSEPVKAIYARILRPYARNRLGSVLLLARGRSLRQEERRVRAGIDRALGGRKSERLQGLDDLVRLTVEGRAIAAQRWLQRALRVWPPIHVIVAAIMLVLLVIHVVYAVRVYG